MLIGESVTGINKLWQCSFCNAVKTASTNLLFIIIIINDIYIMQVRESKHDYEVMPQMH